jgi:hypothetical protein
VYSSSNAPEFGDTILESDLVQTAEHLVVTPAPAPAPGMVHAPAIAELPSPSEPLKRRVNDPSMALTLSSSVPTTAVSETPSDHGGLGESNFYHGTPSLISPVSPGSDKRS